MRLIDADALIDYFADLAKEKDDGFGGTSKMITVKIEHIIKTIAEASTVEPKRGEWIDDIVTRPTASGQGYYIVRMPKCSECKLHFDAKSPFCPNCGAKMDGERKDQ